jgi:hypothetical protein
MLKEKFMNEISEIDITNNHIYKFISSKNSPFNGWNEESRKNFTSKYINSHKKVRENKISTKQFIISSDALNELIEITKARFIELCSQNAPALLLNNISDKKKMASEACLYAFNELRRKFEIPIPENEFKILSITVGEAYVQQLEDQKTYAWINENVKISDADYIKFLWVQAYLDFVLELERKVEKRRHALNDVAIATFSEKIKLYTNKLLPGTLMMSTSESQMKIFIEEMFKYAESRQINKVLRKEEEPPTAKITSGNSLSLFNQSHPETKQGPTPSVTDQISVDQKSLANIKPN